MVIEQAWLLKGFVLAHNAPAEVVAAADAVIAAFPGHAPEARITGDARATVTLPPDQSCSVKEVKRRGRPPKVRSVNDVAGSAAPGEARAPKHLGA